MRDVIDSRRRYLEWLCRACSIPSLAGNPEGLQAMVARLDESAVEDREFITLQRPERLARSATAATQAFCVSSYEPGGGSCCKVQVLPSGSVNEVNEPHARVSTSGASTPLASSS